MNFLKQLKKSFDGKDYLREINQCHYCGKPSFFSTCLMCETNDAYEGWEKKWLEHRDVEILQTLQGTANTGRCVYVRNARIASQNSKA